MCFVKRLSHQRQYMLTMMRSRFGWSKAFTDWRRVSTTRIGQHLRATRDTDADLAQ
jgi:hypothetical protein